MNQAKRLGIFVRTPVPGAVKTRLVPPLSPEQACDLYAAFLQDLFRRVSRLKNTRGTVFYAGEGPETLAPLVPRGWALEAQKGGDLGERLGLAFDRLLAGAGRAVIIGSDSPDLPVQYIRRAFQRLKHKDVALGPATDGGYYLVGLRAPTPGLFEDIAWGGEAVFSQTLDRVRKHELSLSILPLWYDVDDETSLRTLESLVAARRLERRDRLSATEAALERLRG